ALAFLERPSNRIDWDVFVGLCARLEGLVGTENLRSVTNVMYGLRGLEALNAAVSLVTRPTDIYANIFTFVGPALFHNVRSTIQVLDARRVRITLSIPEGFVDCPAFFELCAGGFEVAPVVCGYPRADVRMERSPRACTFTITVDPTRTALEGIRARIRRFLVGPFALGELESQRDEIRQSFQSLHDANEEIERHRRLLADAEAARAAGDAERARLEEQFQRAQKLEGIGLLAGGIAHDFNNLLTGILGNAELALADLPEDAPARECIDRIVRSSVRAADLTNQLLAYAGRQPTTTAPVDVSALVADMGDLLRAAIPRNVALRLDLAPRLPAVTGDRAQLQQVVMNLLTNAAEAAGPHGGTVWVRTALLGVTAERLARSWLQTDAAPGEYVLVEVRDDGAGMDADTLARIFDPFFTTKATGRGLGLSAVLGIVTGHRAVLEVESHPDAGTTFTVLFPSLGGAAPLPAPEPDAPGRATGTVLVAD
ncbi:MAG: two-component system sensor histidine kinase NtrB, partial [Myxococcota bacterium]